MHYLNHELTVTERTSVLILKKKSASNEYVKKQMSEKINKLIYK